MRKFFFLFILIVIASAVTSVYWYYYRPYKEGYHTGLLKKIATRDDFFRTYEGVLLPGNGDNSEPFYFSADDEALADTLSHFVGKTVQLHYVRYRRSLPWRGDNHAVANHGRGQDIVDEGMLILSK